MPASDDHFYSIKRLHAIFAISAVALLAVTVWMLAEDHFRGWKQYQRTYRNRVEPWLTEAQLRAEETESLRAREAELVAALAEAQAAVPDAEQIKARVAALPARADLVDLGPIRAAAELLAAEPNADARQALLGAVDAAAQKLRDRREQLQREYRFASAEADQARSCYEAAVGQGRGADRIETLQRRVDRANAEVEAIARSLDAAELLDESLAELKAEIVREEAAIEEKLADLRAERRRLRRTLTRQRPSLARRVLQWPLLDALGRPLAIEQIWLPELTIDYHFRDVPRADRCVTCHQAIDRSMPGRPGRGACGAETTLHLTLRTEGEPPEADEEPTEPSELSDADGQPEDQAPPRPTLEDVFGLVLADRGMLRAEAPTVELVAPRSPAAWAKLAVGDVIVQVDGQPVDTIAQARRRLLGAVLPEDARKMEDGEDHEEDEEEDIAVELLVRRGLPQPLVSHPRLDLFVGSLSPHPMSEFGCTICHDGQGSATEFKFAAHTPNNPAERRQWKREHEWFRDPHWNYPMLPRRFAESRCLKCHHAVTDLEPTERFPEPPAPKLVEGYHLIRRRGCFGCHEIDGYDASGRQVGPDMRLEPDYAAAALQLLAGGTLGSEEQELARQIVAAPADVKPREELVRRMRWDEAPIENPPGVEENSSGSANGEASEPSSGAAPEADEAREAKQRAAALPPEVQRLLARREADQLLAVLSTNPAAPGTMRKVGPSLRGAADRLDAAFLYHWTRAPSEYRPATRMPAFYGMHEHLSRPALAEALRYEPVELHAMAAYLLDVSQPARPLPVPPGVTEPPSAERGRRLFQLRGCLACHKHEAFPEAQSTEGPDLSRLASKFTQPEASPWLVDWIRDPARHSPRTTMPDALLEPEPLEDVEHGDLPPEAGESPESAEGEPGKMTDPAADIAAFLLRPSEQPWRPGPLPALVERDLDGLALEHLAAVYPRPRAEQILAEGIPFDQAAEFEGDAVALLGPPTLRKKLRYVGRRTIRKRGCAGCHDIPGFEQATLIGPALSDWGRKRESLLAFEQVHRFLAENEPAPSRSPGDEAIGRPETDRAASGSGRATKAEAREAATADDVPELVGGDRRDVSLPLFEEQDRAFYRHAIAGQRREGFIWQKLRAPRSFDYHKAIHKPYNERLTMGRFRLAAAEREAIITFVLGLVGEAPPDRYVYTPDGRRRAIVEGRKVLDRFACAECHTMAMPRWQFEYDPEWFEDPPPLDGFAFNQPQITPEQVAASLEVDRRGLGHAEVVGRPRVDAEGRLIEDEDYDGHPLYFFTLWDPAVINGRVWRVGGPEVMISRPQITGRTPPWGGAFSRLLFPIVVERAREEGGATTAVQSWGWVPPPLVSEGWMARPAWLHRYLLEPTEIRPSVVLRMPRYTLASAEATQLVDYFAAASGQEYPYAPAPQRPTDRGPAADATGGDTGRPDEQPAGNDRPSRLDRAMRVVLDRTTYCAKCHQIGDFTPGGQIDTILAPNLADVHRRLRPDYVRHWLANPKSVLPYTGMPVNFPPAGPPLGQDLFPGSSLEQLDAVVDLLLNYDWYVGRQLSIRQWIERLEAADQPDPQGQNR